MNKLSKFLLMGLLEQESKVTALYGGGFKPPTKGHFEVVQQTLKQHPEIDKLYVVIGSGLRNNISQDESYSIWNIYKKYLPNKVEIVKAQSPLSYIKKYLEENPDSKTYAVIGSREDNEGDIKDFAERKAFFEKYGDNVEVLNILTAGGVSGTKAREAAAISKEEFIKYLPEELTQDEQDLIFDYITSVLRESIQETPKTEYPELIKSLTEYMINQGMNIRPLPKIKFIKDDAENANNFFGKTAYYDPNNRVIVLYTMNRHPKDVMRSFAHEMIHHMQNCEDRLQNIYTNNTNEEGALPEIEREAYEKGNMTFRNWEDNLKNNINEWIIDTPKYNYVPNLSNKLFSQLHELKINEISLNPNNAVEIYGDLDNGDFTVGEYDYNYRIIKLDKNPYNSNSFYSIDFHEIGNKNPNPSLPTKNARENYIKILSTMYKIILDFTQEEKPEYIGISSLDESGYGNIYNNLTKTNPIPGYSRKDAGIQFKDREGKTGKFIVLRRKDV